MSEHPGPVSNSKEYQTDETLATTAPTLSAPNPECPTFPASCTSDFTLQQIQQQQLVQQFFVQRSCSLHPRMESPRGWLGTKERGPSAFCHRRRYRVDPCCDHHHPLQNQPSHPRRRLPRPDRWNIVYFSMYNMPSVVCSLQHSS